MTTEEEFALPSNDRIDRRLIRGQLVERPHPFRCPAHGAVGANLSMLFVNWQRAAGRDWRVFGYGCPYRIERDPDTLLCYDASIIPARLEPTDRRAAFIDGLPILAVKVVDESDSAESVRELLQASIDAGISIVWAIEPELEIIDEFRPGQETRTYICGDEIALNDVLPGFRLPVHKVFGD